MNSLYYRDDMITLYTGDALEVLSTLPSRSVHCVVTSPPYWGLRDYGTGTWIGGDPACRHSVGRETNVPQPKHPSVAFPASAAHRGGEPQMCARCGAIRRDLQCGLEPTPDAYVNRLREVFAELRRVLADTGTAWLNIGDCYSSAPRGRTSEPMRTSTPSGRSAGANLREPVARVGIDRGQVVPRKNLVGIPWRVAFALQGDGWILRNAIVWHKPNAMPESVRDRLSNRYEMLFLLVKQQRYSFDLDQIREPLARPDAINEGIVIGGSNKGRRGGVGPTARRRGRSIYGEQVAKYTDAADFPGRPHGEAMRPGVRHDRIYPRGKNPGDVWSMPTRPLRAAHFAAFTIDLPLRCIAAGCPPESTVLDPFSGAATTGLAAQRLSRPYIGIDLNPSFHAIGLERLGLADQLAEDAA